jgi:hypothetical protein
MPTVYKSMNTGAPNLTGQAGSLLDVLDGCLVNGYGSKAAAGWTIPFTGTNLRVYRAPAGGPRHYLNVVDTGTTKAQMNGYRLCTGVGAGTGAFPLTTAQAYVQKSTTADAVQRPWVLVADNRSFIFMSDPGVTSYANFQGYLHMFGEFYSMMSSDGYRSLCGGADASSNYLAPVSGGRLGIARNYTQVGSSILMFIGGHRGMGGLGSVGNGQPSGWLPAGIPFPNPGDNSVHINRITVESPTHGLRGYVRGLWAVENSGFSTDLSDTTDVDGSGVYAGKNFEMVQARSQYGTGWIAWETTAWESNS